MHPDPIRYCNEGTEEIVKELRMYTYSPYVAATGRLLIALLFIISAVGKIASPRMTQGYIASVGLPLPLVTYFIAICLNVAGGALLIVGFQTRIVALVLAAYTVVAALAFHTNFGDPDQLIHFLKNIAIAGGLLQVAAFGAGKLSVDERNGHSAEPKLQDMRL
jgi:putative oxidoreductase